MSAANWVTKKTAQAFRLGSCLVVHEISLKRFNWLAVDAWDVAKGTSTTMRGAKAAAERAARRLAKVVSK